MAATKKKAASVAAVPAPYDDSEWRAEDDLRTLVSAAKIRKDPKRMAAVRKKEREMRAAMADATATPK